MMGLMKMMGAIIKRIGIEKRHEYPACSPEMRCPGGEGGTEVFW
jgi:hypothetical protein